MLFHENIFQHPLLLFDHNLSIWQNGKSNPLFSICYINDLHRQKSTTARSVWKQKSLEWPNILCSTRMLHQKIEFRSSLNNNLLFILMHKASDLSKLLLRCALHSGNILLVLCAIVSQNVANVSLELNWNEKDSVLICNSSLKIINRTLKIYFVYKSLTRWNNALKSQLILQQL